MNRHFLEFIYLFSKVPNSIVSLYAIFSASMDHACIGAAIETYGGLKTQVPRLASVLIEVIKQAW